MKTMLAFAKRTAIGALENMLAMSWRSSAFRNLLQRFVLERTMGDPHRNYSANWRALDRLFTASRRQLLSIPGWRYGTSFVHTVVTRTVRELTRYTPIEGKVYCDIGCGQYHPYGISAVMYINGATSTIAVDMQEANRARAAEALYDLLVDCLAHPQDWRLSSICKEEFFDRIGRFNLKALRLGDLNDGLADTPLRYVIGDIRDVGIQPESIDLMSTTAVLEHFLDFETAAKQLFSFMSAGAIACHAIDLKDHRAYAQPEKYSWWSFLAEEESWSDSHTSRLRSTEIRHLLEKTGFEILRYDGTERGDLPADIRNSFKGRFSSMSEEELSITRVDCVLRKPAQQRVVPHVINGTNGVGTCVAEFS